MDAVERADVHTLIGAYALDALEDDEREAFERHLAECEPCREEVVGFRRTAVRLAEAAAVVPPPRMRGRVLREIADDPPGARHRPRRRGAAPADGAATLPAVAGRGRRARRASPWARRASAWNQYRRG